MISSFGVQSMRLALRAMVVFPLLLAPLQAGAQAVQAGEFATVALVPDLGPGGGNAVVERHASGRFKNVILLRADDADEALLTTAVASLFLSRHKIGDALQNEVVIRINGRKSAGALTSQEKQLSATFLARLRSARPVAVPGHGMAPALRINLGPLQSHS